MTTLKIRAITAIARKRRNDDTQSEHYNCSAITDENKITHVSVPTSDDAEKLAINTFFLLKGFRINPRGETTLFADFVNPTNSKVRTVQSIVLYVTCYFISLQV